MNGPSGYPSAYSGGTALGQTGANSVVKRPDQIPLSELLKSTSSLIDGLENRIRDITQNNDKLFGVEPEDPSAPVPLPPISSVHGAVADIDSRLSRLLSKLDYQLGRFNKFLQG